MLRWILRVCWNPFRMDRCTTEFLKGAISFYISTVFYVSVPLPPNGPECTVTGAHEWSALVQLEPRNITMDCWSGV